MKHEVKSFEELHATRPGINNANDTHKESLNLQERICLVKIGQNQIPNHRIQNREFV